jgi:hypothetical protein
MANVPAGIGTWPRGGRLLRLAGGVAGVVEGVVDGVVEGGLPVPVERVGAQQP